MSKKTAVETAPTRSAARAVLAARIAAREKARETIAEKQAAHRRLALIGESAQALAAQLGGLKASAAAALADHVLNGSGAVPKLADDGRADVAAKLAEAEARAEAAGPAMDAVEAAITAAVADHNRSSAAVAAVVRPVVEEEVARLVQETQAAVDQLAPLVRRLVGARAYAYDSAHAGGEDQREAFIALGNQIDAAMTALRVDPRTPVDGADADWSALSNRLIVDPDAA